MKILKLLFLVCIFFIHATVFAGLSETVDALEKKIWKDFVCEYGFVLDYKGDFPSPQDCLDGRPNYLNWWGPTENAAKFTGLYLASVCQRHTLIPNESDAEKARRLAKGLMLCASVSDVKGFISRGVSSDGRTHYPIGSVDQTLPWIYGMYMYLKSDIPNAAEKGEVKAKIIEVCSALDENGWKCPCDGKFKGQYSGGFSGFRFFDAPCMLFGLRVMWDLTQSDHWRQKYYSALRQADPNTGKSRMEICANGYKFDADWLYDIDKNFLWIYVKCQAVLRILYDMEVDPQVRASYFAGLCSNAKSALKSAGDYKLYDNSANYPFTSADWRRIYKWRPQESQVEAKKLAMEQLKSYKHGAARKAERNYMTNAMSAVAMLAFSGESKYRKLAEEAISHYDYSKFHLGEIIYASVAYSALKTYVKEMPGK